METPEQPRRELSIVTERSKDSVTVPVTGAWGGPSPGDPAGTIVAHFYLEYNTTPSIINVEVDDQGRIDPNAGRRTSRGDITREVQATFMMSPEIAVSIGQWLVNKGGEMLARRSKNG